MKNDTAVDRRIDEYYSMGRKLRCYCVVDPSLRREDLIAQVSERTGCAHTDDVFRGGLRAVTGRGDHPKITRLPDKRLRCGDLKSAV